MAYFQLIEQYPLGTARGGCYLCGEGGTVQSPKVDTGIVIDFEGGLVMCLPCIRQIAQLCGLVERSMVAEAEASMHDLQRAADEAIAERDEMRQLVHLLRRADERSPVGNFLPSEADHEPLIVLDPDEVPPLGAGAEYEQPRPARKPRARAAA